MAVRGTLYRSPGLAVLRVCVYRSSGSANRVYTRHQNGEEHPEDLAIDNGPQSWCWCLLGMTFLLGLWDTEGYCPLVPVVRPSVSTMVKSTQRIQQLTWVPKTDINVMGMLRSPEFCGTQKEECDKKPKTNGNDILFETERGVGSWNNRFFSLLRHEYSTMFLPKCLLLQWLDHALFEMTFHLSTGYWKSVGSEMNRFFLSARMPQCFVSSKTPSVCSQEKFLPCLAVRRCSFRKSGWLPHRLVMQGRDWWRQIVWSCGPGAGYNYSAADLRF